MKRLTIGNTYTVKLYTTGMTIFCTNWSSLKPGLLSLDSVIFRFQERDYSRMEKADILEMAVRFLRGVHQAGELS